MNLSKRKVLISAFFDSHDSQFKYCPLIWMCHGRTSSRKTERLHEIFQRIIYNDKQSSFKKLLKKDRSVSIYEKNVRDRPLKCIKSVVTSHPKSLNKFKKAIKKRKPGNCLCRISKTINIDSNTWIIYLLDINYFPDF